MKAETIISEILAFLKEPNVVFDGNVYQFSPLSRKGVFEKNGRRLGPTYVIYGLDRLNKYRSLFSDLYKEVVGPKKISLKTFQNAAQDLLFDQKFNLEAIQSLVDNMPVVKIWNIRRIYGLSIQKDFVNYGIFTFVKKEKLLNFILENKLFQLGDDLGTSSLQSEADSAAKDEANFVYVLVAIDAPDNIYASAEMDKYLENLIYTIRVLAFVKNERFYIDDKPFRAYEISNYQLANGKLLSGWQFKYKDRAIPIDDSSFYDLSNGSQRLWNILSSDEKTDIEQRIIAAVVWLGKSFDTDDQSVICSDAASAFEALLFRNEKGIITPGIVANLSEAYAFINGDDCETRIKMEKEFKDFYSDRSSVVHGFSKRTFAVDPLKYCLMARSTVVNLLTKDTFKSFRTSEELWDYIQKLKYQ